MSVPPIHEVTGLQQAWSAGDEAALEKLTPLVYEELRRTAHRYMTQEQTGHTLQTTALVNEVYIRLVKVSEVNWQNRTHFFAVCARMMRRILTDFARSRRYLKRGGNAARVPFDEALLGGIDAPPDIVALDDALEGLARLSCWAGLLAVRGRLRLSQSAATAQALTDIHAAGFLGKRSKRAAVTLASVRASAPSGSPPILTALVG